MLPMSEVLKAGARAIGNKGYLWGVGCPGEEGGGEVVGGGGGGCGS